MDFYDQSEIIHECGGVSLGEGLAAMREWPFMPEHLLIMDGDQTPPMRLMYDPIYEMLAGIEWWQTKLRIIRPLVLHRQTSLPHEHPTPPTLGPNGERDEVRERRLERRLEMRKRFSLRHPVCLDVFTVGPSPQYGDAMLISMLTAAIMSPHPPAILLVTNDAALRSNVTRLVEESGSGRSVISVCNCVSHILEAIHHCLFLSSVTGPGLGHCERIIRSISISSTPSLYILCQRLRDNLSPESAAALQEMGDPDEMGGEDLRDAYLKYLAPAGVTSCTMGTIFEIDAGNFRKWARLEGEYRHGGQGGRAVRSLLIALMDML
jgi:hypothetical protein